jgi:hypothetical protein
MDWNAIYGAIPAIIIFVLIINWLREKSQDQIKETQRRVEQAQTNNARAQRELEKRRKQSFTGDGRRCKYCSSRIWKIEVTTEWHGRATSTKPSYTTGKEWVNWEFEGICRHAIESSDSVHSGHEPRTPLPGD